MGAFSHWHERQEQEAAKYMQAIMPSLYQDLLYLPTHMICIVTKEHTVFTHHQTPACHCFLFSHC